MLRLEKRTVRHHLSRNFENIFRSLGEINLRQIITNIHTVRKRHRRKPRPRVVLQMFALLSFQILLKYILIRTSITIISVDPTFHS